MSAILRIILLLACLFHFTTLRAEDGRLLQTAYKPSFQQGTIEAYLADIKNKAGVSISFSTATIEPTQKVKLTGTEQTVNEVLVTILADQKVDIVERKDKILIISKIPKKKSHKESNHTINGYIKEDGSKEALIGAIIYVPALKVGTVTNNFGFYSLSLPEDRYEVVCSYTGYKPDAFSISLREDNRRDILLASQNKLNEVVVTPEKKITADKVQLFSDDVNRKPAPLGENDLMRTLQTVAGVQTTVDGSSQILVRGGDPGQNLCLLDGTPIYYTDHFFGVTSVFNTEAIKSVDFYKGAFPARYGGRLSSIIDINTKDGDMQRWGGQFSLGLVKGGLNLEGPIIKDKASIMVAARRTWIDALWRPFTDDFRFNFYDINAKANYIVNKNNRLYLSFYTGRDRVTSTANDFIETDLKQGNAVGALKWSTIVNPKLFVNSLITYSNFNFQFRNSLPILQNGVTTFNANYTGISLIKEASLKIQGHWYPNAFHHIETGLQYSRSDFNPASVVPDTNTFYLGMLSADANKFRSNEVVLYAEDEIKTGDKWVLRPGVHVANWFNNSYSYSSIQPRMYVAYSINNSNTLYASYTQMAQFLHLVTNNNIDPTIPSEIWLPSSKSLEPEESMIGTLGYAGNVRKSFEYSVELYYKDIKNITTYMAGMDLFDNTSYWEDKLIQGKGWSYGSEVSLFEKIGPFKISAAYTLSWTWRQFDLLNNGKVYPYRYDRRHNIKAGLTYQKNTKFAATANWTYLSGEAITVPNQIYSNLDENLQIDNQPADPASNYVYNYSDLNNYRLPPIHRLDLACDFHKQKGKRVTRTWSLGVFNFYGQKNVMFVRLAPVTPGEFRIQGDNFLSFVPYVTYKLKF